MKLFILKKVFFALSLVGVNMLYSQEIKTAPFKSMFSLNEDNDFINLRGKGTDEAYTNGLRLELFTQNTGSRKPKLTRWMPNAGNNSINISSWGITQLMYTPENIQTTIPDPSDFAYAGALFLSRSLHSSNPVKKYLFKTEVQIGIIGPPSLAKEAQTAIHNLIKYQKPMGWEYQIPTDLVLNVNFLIEKQLFAWGSWLETIVGSEVKMGTLYTGITIHSLFRVGNISPYFNGLIDKYSLYQQMEEHPKKWITVHFILKPKLEYVNRNSLLSGGYFGSKRNLSIAHWLAERESDRPQIATPRRYLIGLDYGFILNMKKTSIEVTQKVISEAIIGAPHHEVGNISVHFLW